MEPRLKTRELNLRERQVVQLRAEGLTFKQVGERLGLTESTAKQYMCRARNKTGKTPYQMVMEQARNPQCSACLYKLRLEEIDSTLLENGYDVLV